MGISEMANQKRNHGPEDKLSYAKIEELLEGMLDRKLKPVNEKLTSVIDTQNVLKANMAKLQESVDQINEKIDKVLDAIYQAEREALRNLESVKKKVEKGFASSKKQLDRLEEDVSSVKKTVGQIKRYLKESNIEINTTASDFDGALMAIGVRFKTSEDNDEIDFKNYSANDIMSVGSYLAGNVFRICDNKSFYLKDEKLKSFYENNGFLYALDMNAIQGKIDDLPEVEKSRFNKYRNASLGQIIRQTAMQMRQKIYCQVSLTGRPLEAKEIKKIYESSIEDLNKKNWMDNREAMSKRGASTMIASNALILLQKNREYFMKYNKAGFEEKIGDIKRSFYEDERAMDGSNAGSTVGGSLRSFMSSLSNGSQTGFEYDPNRMNSVLTVKNLAYGIRVGASSFVFERAKGLVGDEVAEELRDMTQQMNTHQGLMASLYKYIQENKDSANAPDPGVYQRIEAYYKGMKSQWYMGSFEAQLIARDAFNIAIAKKESNSYRHVGARNVSALDKEKADRVIAAACILDCKYAKEYVNGTMDENRTSIRQSIIHEMEKSKDLHRLTKIISPEIKKAKQAYQKDHKDVPQFSL